MPIRRTLYPQIAPYAHGYLRVSDVHEIYWESSGNPDGFPVLFLHGGPGGGCDSKHRRFYDPHHYRIILFDQRACGRSRPRASLVENTTPHLVSDIEKLRTFLEIDRWHVAGGSWGSTLAIVYAEAYPERVLSLILRGVFTFTEQEYRWFFESGAPRIFPDLFADFVAPIPLVERDDIIAAYYRRLVAPTSDTESSRAHAERIAFAEAWSLYECRLATFYMNPGVRIICSRPEFTLPFATIECHYLQHRGFLGHSNQLYDQLDRIENIPTTIVHGRYDMVCPIATAWQLCQRLPQINLHIVADGGHSAFDPSILSKLIETSDRHREFSSI